MDFGVPRHGMAIERCLYWWAEATFCSCEESLDTESDRYMEVPNKIPLYSIYSMPYCITKLYANH